MDRADFLALPGAHTASDHAACARLPAAAYHADPCPRPSLSASIARALVADTPRHAWLRHPRLGGGAREYKSELDRGTVIHALVLGTDPLVCPLDYENYRTKAAQEARDAARDAGRLPVLTRELDEWAAVARAVKAELAAREIDLSGESEAVLYWEEETSAGPVLCRGMTDHLALGEFSATILDLKTCPSARPRDCEQHVTRYGYDVQRAAYVSAVEKLRPDLAGRVEFLWLFAEELPAAADGQPRVALNVCRAGGALRELGERKWARACRTWAECLESGEWPAYAGLVELEAKPWDLAEEGALS